MPPLPPPMSSPRTGISKNQTQMPSGVHLDLNQCTATPPPTGMMLALSPNSTKQPQIMQQLRPSSRIGSKADTQHQFLSSSMALLSSNTLHPLHSEQQQQQQQQIKTHLMTGMTK